MPEGDTIHAAARRVGAALVGKEIVSIDAGIGNVWKSEGCFDARIDPWRGVADVSDAEALRIVAATRLRMQESVSRGGHIRGLRVHDRAGRSCPRCNQRLAARGQGDDNRTTYWCPGCQA